MGTSVKQYHENKRRGIETFPLSYYKEKYSNHMIKLHWHSEIELLYGISGELAVSVSDEKYILREGDIFFINPEELHTYSPISEEVQYHAAVFHPSIFQFHENHFFQQDFTEPLLSGELHFPRMIRVDDEVYHVVQTVVHRLFNEDIRIKELAFADLVMLFGLLLKYSLMNREVNATAHRKAEDVKKCISYMEENYKNKITLAELADLVHMNPNYFCNYFKKQTGVTPFQQLNYIRIKNAAKMLKQNEDSIADVAIACGFENVSFFIRKFKEIRGCTPSAYRKNV